MSMLTRKLLRDLWATKGQVVTIALVVASGIAAFVASLSTYESLKRMQADYYESARFAHVFASARRVPNSVAPALLEIPGVVEAQATLTYDAMIDLPGVVEPLVGRMIALPEHGLPAMNRLTLMAGRWIDAPESNQVLVNQTFAQKRGLAPGSTLTALLNGKRETLVVVGIVLSPGYIFAAAHGAGDESSFGVFWIGRKRLAAAFNMEGAFNTAALRIGRDAPERVVIDRLDHLLAPYGTIGANARDEQPSHKALTQEIGEQKVFGLVLPSVFLGVAVFLLNVVLTRQIGTQRGQIAALKALGCPDWRIGLHYLEYVLAIVLLGIAIGMAAGAWLGHMLTALYTNFFHFPALDYAMPAWIPLVGALASLAGAVTGALQAMLKVVRLPPAEAMRPASPLTYRATLLERIGLGRLYSPAARMILRDLERRPARALATTLGVAGAVAILISGTWCRDAIDHLLDVEFRMRERQDVAMVLVEPASSAVAYDLARLPGVLRAEPDRVAAARLWHGHRSYRTTITGLTPEGSIRLLLDAKLQQVPLPAQGLAINQTLADLLGVTLGDSVRVEILQGARAARGAGGRADRRPDGHAGVHAHRCAQRADGRGRRGDRCAHPDRRRRARGLPAAGEGNAAHCRRRGDRSDRAQLPRDLGAQRADLHHGAVGAGGHDRGGRGLQQRAHRAGGARLGAGQPARARHDARRGLRPAAGRTGARGAGRAAAGLAGRLRPVGLHRRADPSGDLPHPADHPAAHLCPGQRGGAGRRRGQRAGRAAADRPTRPGGRPEDARLMTRGHAADGMHPLRSDRIDVTALRHARRTS